MRARHSSRLYRRELLTEAVVPLKSKTDWKDIDDPSRDGWSAEVRAEQAKQRLYGFGKLVFQDSQLDSEAISQLAAIDYSSAELLPPQTRQDPG